MHLCFAVGKPEAKTQYDNAVTAYGKAIEVGDDPALLLSLAVALDKAGNTPEALKTLKKLSATPDLKPDVQKKAEAKTDELTMKVGIVMLQITPEGTQIMIGGETTRSVRVLASTPLGPCLTIASSTPASSSASAAFSGSVSPTATSHSSRLPTATVTYGSALRTCSPAASGVAQNIGR